MMLPHPEGLHVPAPTRRKVGLENVHRRHDVVDVAVDETGFGPLSGLSLSYSFNHISSSVPVLSKRPFSEPVEGASVLHEYPALQLRRQIDRQGGFALVA